MADYQAFEVKDGGCLERVERMCRHLTDKGKFTDATPVTASDAMLALDDAYYLICGELQKHGYDTTVASTATKALAVLEQIQALDAVATIEFGMPVSDTGEPNDRYRSMIARRDRLIGDYMRGDALQWLGGTRLRSRSQYLEGTGRSLAAKRAVYNNSDVVPGRFPSGFGQHTGTPNRSGRQGGASGADGNLQ